MPEFPQHYVWQHDGSFVSRDALEPGVILVADSWRVHNGNMWRLADHMARFARGAAVQGISIPGRSTAVHTAVEAIVAETAASYPETALFPRLSLEDHRGELVLVLLIRPAPAVRDTTTLCIPEYTDPRTRPTVKGPDIDLMRRLVSEAATDDVVLHDGTNVIETTTGALLIWPTPTQLVLCEASQQLASISAQRIAHHARSRNISVTTRPVTIQDLVSGEYPVWFSNTLHGISPVTTIVDASGEHPIAAHPNVQQWQAAWWQPFAASRRRG